LSAAIELRRRFPGITNNEKGAATRPDHCRLAATGCAGRQDDAATAEGKA
jgi:hypothetical protein